MSRHRIVNPPELAPARGFAHAVVAVPGQTVYLGGQTGADATGRIVGATLVEQFDAALANVVAALRAAGAEPDHLVSLTMYVTDVDDYRCHTSDLGAVYRRHLHRHYPAIALFGVVALADPAALVELVGVAVVPD
ncbi:MAG: RidA family protein [Mycobacteriales bacterium]|nr:MAG: RidA family protein [Pseudonocardiales bacterium]